MQKFGCHEDDRNPEERMLSKSQINFGFREGQRGNKYGCDIMPRQRGLIDP